MDNQTATIAELPTIRYKGKTYTYDYRLQELRQTNKDGIKFIFLDNDENELLSFAISEKSKHLINVNMQELEEKNKI